MDNLCSNILKYAAPGNPVVIRNWQEKNYMVLSFFCQTLYDARMAAATGCGNSNKNADTKTKTESPANAGTSEKKADSTQKENKADSSKKQEEQKKTEAD